MPLCFITAVQRLDRSCIPVMTPSLLMRLITRVTSLHNSSMLLKRFPRGVSSISGTSQRLVGSCQDCTAGGEALAIHTFPKFPILHLRHEAARMIAGYCARSDSSQFRLPFQGSVLHNRDHVPANTHTLFFTEVWLTTFAKFRTIASSYWPRARSVQNFWNDQSNGSYLPKNRWAYET